MEENVCTIGALIERNARCYRDKPYLCFGNRHVSYEELHRITNKLANGLLKIGIRKNDKVCVMMTNRPEFLYSWFAINKIGAIMVPVNTAFRGPELAYIIRHAESKAIISETPFWLALNELSGDDRFSPIIATGDVEGHGVISFVGLLEGSPEKLLPMEVSETDHAVYLYTSGTTGPPKGVMLSHRAYVQTARSFVMAVGAGPHDSIMTPNPLFHINAECYSTMGSMVAGATLILLDRFSASGLAAEIERHRPTIMVLVLASATILCNKHRQSDPWHTSLRTIVAGGVPRGEYRNFERTFGVKLQNIYSDRGSDCAADEIGEIVIQNTALMEGYFKDPAATRQALRDGFFYTGDKGRRDADGYV